MFKFVDEISKQIKKGNTRGALLFNDGIVTLDTEIENIKIGVHLGGFHDKIDITSEGRIHDDVESYRTDDWDEGDEERIVYKDKVVIFGVDEMSTPYLKIYSFLDRINQGIDLK